MAYYNNSGYRDPVMEAVIKNDNGHSDYSDQKNAEKKRQADQARGQRVLMLIRRVAQEMGYNIQGSLTIMDRKTRERYTL